jgi:1,2-diacylglycerol 3-alpha-glucosyltransferase
VRIGICSYWFNRGQGVVSRHLRSALDSLGHETFVLARPTRASNIRPAFVDRTGVWDQPNITEASSYEIPPGEYKDWARDKELAVCFFDQNYGFEGIAALRDMGVRTVGRFVWEQFSPEHTGPAGEAFDIVYSLTECEQERYRALGIRSPRVPWGIHPELLEQAGQETAGNPAAPGTCVYIYPGGFMSARKPFEAVLEAFGRTTDPRLRLIFRAQVDRHMKGVRKRVRRDGRVEVVSEDLPIGEHLRLFASADVCIAPSRWEGLGLHLFEAVAFGIPVITNDNPPMNEVVHDGENGLLVPGVRAGEAKSGIPAYEPDVDALVDAIERLADDGERSRLADGARRARERLSWERTVAGYRDLLAEL